jgi:peroxiredoxin
LVFTSRRFASEEAFSSIGDSDKYGDYLLTNGTLDAKVSLPAQFVRLRLLNAEIERGYDFGFSDGRVFYVIATDGGLTDKPIPVKRMKLMVGERVELLVDLSGDKIGSTLDLMTYNARQPFGFPGGEPGSGRPNGSLLNAKEFRLLHIDVAAPTAAAITKLPETLAENHFPTEADVKQRRTLRIVRFGPPEREFAFDSKYFDMNTINFAVKLGDVEAWTISNDQTFGHSFHIHDIQFKIIKRSDGPVPDYEQGWKDTVYVPRGASVTFVARFDDFASDVDPFMYHCHMSNHEDGGLMGQFLVVKDPESLKKDSSGKMAFRSRLEHPLTPDLIAAAERQARTQAPPFKATDLNGQTLRLVTLTEKKPLVLFFIERDCPCSKDAAPLFDRLQTEYGDACTVVGVINAEKSIAREWAKQVGPHFAIIADPDLTIIDAYGAERSVYTTIVEPGGKIAKTFPGYSVDMLTELASTIARLGQTKERPLSFEGAPKKLVGGCPMRTP